MAASKKYLKKATVKKKLAMSVPVASPDPPRIAMKLMGQTFYAEASAAISCMIVETSCKDMTVDAFRDWAARYRLRLEMWISPTGPHKIVLIDNGQITAGWLKKPVPPRRTK